MINRVILVGRITKDPELRQTANGISTVSFSIAVERITKDANGERQADFINCVAWRNNADFLSKYIRKGYMMGVEGRIQTRNYQNQQGQTVYVTEVVCDTITNLQPREQGTQPSNFQQPNNYQQPREDNNNGGYNNYNNNNSYNNNVNPSYQQPRNNNYGQAPETKDTFNVGDVSDDDLPF